MDNEQVVVNEENDAPAAQTEVRENREPREQRERVPFRNKRRKKVCLYCADKIDYIDYKDTVRIRKCLSERAKILPRRVTGTCARHQRQLTVAVKRARHLALIPYITD
ncbi:MAG: 30S ribosomal protein S18 [Clostridia bacterium]|nr:30S ribosomal protein S18 [Clostridia bacterium]